MDKHSDFIRNFGFKEFSDDFIPTLKKIENNLSRKQMVLLGWNSAFNYLYNLIAYEQEEGLW